MLVGWIKWPCCRFQHRANVQACQLQASSEVAARESDIGGNLQEPDKQ